MARSSAGTLERMRCAATEARSAVDLIDPRSRAQLAGVQSDVDGQLRKPLAAADLPDAVEPGRRWVGIGASDVGAVRSETTRDTDDADGSPRVSGTEVFDGELWLGFMANSWKGRDPLRDPRFALHCSSALQRRAEIGDAEISGTAEFIRDPAPRKPYARWLADFDPGDEFDLFRAEITEAALTATGDGGARHRDLAPAGRRHRPDTSLTARRPL